MKTKTQDWQPVAKAEALQKAGRLVVKVDGKQILLLWQDGQVLACNNRCPHEGYPLSEGDVSGCVLTCNWHNWKFDLDSGETLVGGDKLRRYPARIVARQVELDLIDPPAEAAIAQALDNITDCFDRHEYDRIARELARLMKAGGDPLDGLRRTIARVGDRFEYGATHALPAAADWLSLRGETQDPVRQLGMLTECIGHFAWDTRREPVFSYPTTSRAWDEDAYVAAVEAEDEAAACSHVRGAVSDGLTWSDMERGFARAALSHYADFGHSAIYTYKMRALTAALGDRESLLMLCLMLTRSFIYASREDLIPEFRAYGKALKAWDGQGSEQPDSESLRRGSAREILALDWQDKTDSSIAQSVDWLDFTHTVTFGNAVRKLAERYPDLWPQGLLQMGCFLGRNSGFTDPDIDEAPWRSNDPLEAVQQALSGVEDHGKFEYIVSSHLLKLSYAIREEIPETQFNALAAAALRRFLASPLKRKHVQRTAYQALNFVQAEG